MFIKLYLIALPVFFTIDMLWLGLIAKNFYRRELGFLMAENVNWVSAILFYLLFIAGIVFFVLMPNINKNSVLAVVLSGAFFGFITYATYDLTNLATLKDWPLTMTIVDLLWGAFLSASVSFITYILFTKFFI